MSLQGFKSALKVCDLGLTMVVKLKVGMMVKR
jgi:hypothetical protein